MESTADDYGNGERKDIAAMLGITESTSKTQLLKARKVLRKKIENIIENYQTNRVIAI